MVKMDKMVNPDQKVLQVLKDLLVNSENQEPTVLMVSAVNAVHQVCQVQKVNQVNRVPQGHKVHKDPKDQKVKTLKSTSNLGKKFILWLKIIVDAKLARIRLLVLFRRKNTGKAEVSRWMTLIVIV